MLFKTRGIVLNYTKFRDSSIIVRMFTEKFGKQSYIVNGIRSKKSKKSIGVFQPLSLLELVVYQKESRQIQRISEYKSAFPFKSIPYNVKKSTIALFVTEILVKAMTEHHEEDSELFDFLFQAIRSFDECTTGFENFHIYLLLNLKYFIGFGLPDLEALNTGGDLELSQFLSQFLKKPDYYTIQSNRITRNNALAALIKFYRTHVENFGQIKSLDIMRQVFD